MRIYGVGKTDSTSFERNFNAKELQVYTNSINEGLKLLNKQVDIIIHNSAAPSVEKENIGIGTLFSDTVQKKLLPFLKSHGFTGIQQEPNSLRKPCDPSPYAPESSAKNIYMIPLEKLTTKKYGEILPRKIFNEFAMRNPHKERVDYVYISKNIETLLTIAYLRFLKYGLPEQKSEFEQFKKDNANFLEKSAIFKILDNKYKKSWKEWDGIDKNLYAPKNEQEQIEAKNRIEEIKAKHKDEFDSFMFRQFILEKENKDSNEITKKAGITIIGDSPVASPAADEWANQNLFLEGKSIGAAPDAFSDEGQTWGFGYFNPKYIFNPDGTLGKAGKIMKEKYDRFFASFPGGLRIDHVIGLVDPFIYSGEKIKPETSGRIYSEGEFKKTEEEYSNILEKIVLQSAKEHGMSKDNIICEDLGEPNFPTQRVMKKLDLSGLAVTQFDYRGAETPAKNVIMIGSHDNASFLEYTDKFFAEASNQNINKRNLFNKILLYYAYKFNLTDVGSEKLRHFMIKTKYLAEDTAPKDATEKEIQQYTKEIRTDKKKFIEASFAELFTSPARRIQIFFADFWGLGKTYNTPGTKTGNWELRIPSNFEKEYYKAVAEGKAPNLAKAIATALRQRGLDKSHPELMENLDNSAKILAEV